MEPSLVMMTKEMTIIILQVEAKPKIWKTMTFNVRMVEEDKREREGGREEDTRRFEFDPSHGAVAKADKDDEDNCMGDDPIFDPN